MQPEANARFFREVEALPGYKLRVGTLPGEEILFDFSARLGLTRYADLRDAALFNSVATDGVSLLFELPGKMPVRVSAGEFFQLLAKKPGKQISNTTQTEGEKL